MYKIFTLVVAIAFIPLPQYFTSPVITNLPHKNAFNSTKLPSFKNSNTVSPFETKKNNTVDTAALKQSNWYAEVIKNIEASEYEIKKDEQSGLFCAPNRKQNLKAFYSSDQFTLTPRNDSADKWKLTLLLKGVYEGKNKLYTPVVNPVVTQNGKSIQFNNNNQFITEYINNKEGVRQNFIINRQPAGNPEKLSVQLEANKGWLVNRANAKEIHFAKASGKGYNKKLTYNDLKVWDANNTELEASFAVNKNKISIDVVTKNAVYPITIDPISTTPATILYGIATNDQFGFSVASAGDVNGDGYSDVVVGAFRVAGQKGAAYIFLGSNTGLSSSPVTTLNGISGNDQFGVSVAGAGDVNGDGYSDVIIGANGRSSNIGAAYIFLGSSAVFSSSPIQTLSGVSAGDNFGISVASAGDVNGDGYSDVIIGANGRSSNIGAAYIFRGSSGIFSSTPAATLNGISVNDVFGSSVAGTGDVNGDSYSDVIVGASGVSSNRGAAYIFLGSNGVFSTSPAKTFNGVSAGDYFGTSVACAGDVNGDGYSDVIVGAYGVSTFRGAAYIFLGSGGVISSSPAAILNGITGFDAFGNSVACAGDVNGDGYSDVIVGAFGVSSNRGAAYIFLGSNGVFSSTPVTTLNGISVNDEFGRSVASVGDVNGDGFSDIIVGAEGVSSYTGAAYIYHGSPNGLKTTNNWQVLEAQGGANYGLSVTSAGDVNSDGFSDVIVGAYIYDQGFGDNGKAWLYMGSAVGLSTTAAWTAVGSMANEYFGRCVAAAGDVNGDGYGDVIVGAYGYTNGQSQEGRAYLYYGSSGGLAGTAAWTYENNFAGSILGAYLSAAGDVNKDGYSDIIIGAPQYDVDGIIEIDEGKVYLFYGSATIPAAMPDWSAEGNQTGAFFGISVASLGDVNGDGYSDVIIGAHTYDNPEIDEGKVFAFYGSATGLPAVANWTAESNQPNAQFGISVASAGDVNGDGYSDAIVGATYYDDPTTDEGAAFVYYGSPTGLSPTISWTAESNIASSYFGYSVSSAGDVNGDGYSDVVVGAREISNGQSREGAMYAYYGSSTGLSLTTNWYVESNVATSLLGNSVASAGDVNGDGYSDVIGGAPYYGGLNGAAFVYYGNNNTGLHNNLKLYNTDLTTPIGYFNITEPNLFGAGLFAKSPLGRVKGKLVWEVKKQGDAFSGIPITNSTAFLGKASYIDLGITGIELKSNVQKVGSRNNKIRTRVEYDKVTAITGQVYGPWRYPAAYLQGAHGMNSIPLPVKLNSFDGTLVLEKVTLQWSSSDDENVATYQIERSSDNWNFTVIGNVNSIHLNSNSYDFTDPHPLKGRSWYRLKITDEFKRINYSNSILIKNTNEAVWVYPTVLNRREKINLQFKNSFTGIVEIQLMNMSGAAVFKKAMTANGTVLPVELPSLSSGVYILSAMQGGEKIITQKIIIR